MQKRGGHFPRHYNAFQMASRIVHRYFPHMRTTDDTTRKRLREIEAELMELEIAARGLRTSMPSTADYARALMLEARRIERIADQREHR